MIKSKQILGSFMLIFAAVIWGLSFVAQSVGMESVDGFTFNGIRTVIGAVVLLPVIAFRSKRRKADLGASRPEDKKKSRKQLIRAGLCCGLVLFAGSNLQQFAFQYTTVGKVGFVTALYMIMVPIMGIALKKKANPLVWFSAALGCGGLYLLCCSGQSVSFGKGELLALACAVMFAIHILVIDKFAPLVDCVQLSCAQFAVSGVLSVLCMFIFEKPQMSAILSAAPSILYAGIMSCGVAFTLQIAGQQYTEPTIASMLLCLESVFSVLFGWVILHQALSLPEIAGCTIMFIAILLAQLPSKSKVKSE